MFTVVKLSTFRFHQASALLASMEIALMFLKCTFLTREMFSISQNSYPTHNYVQTLPVINLQQDRRLSMSLKIMLSGFFYGNFLLYTYCNFLSPPVLFLVSPCAILLKNTLEVPLMADKFSYDVEKKRSPNQLSNADYASSKYCFIFKLAGD